MQIHFAKDRSRWSTLATWLSLDCTRERSNCVPRRRYWTCSLLQLPPAWTGPNSRVRWNHRLGCGDPDWGGILLMRLQAETICMCKAVWCRRWIWSSYDAELLWNTSFRFGGLWGEIYQWCKFGRPMRMWCKFERPMRTDFSDLRFIVIWNQTPWHWKRESNSGHVACTTKRPSFWWMLFPASQKHTHGLSYRNLPFECWWR